MSTAETWFNHEVEPITEEKFMGGQFKCNCGNSFDSLVALAVHKAMAHLNK